MPKGPERRRREILESAVKLFGVNGHAATKMSDIVADVGGSKATLYKYFPSKKSLFRAVLEILARTDLRASDALLDDKKPLRTRIRDFAYVYLRYVAQPRVVEVRRLLIAEAHRSQLGPQIYRTNILSTWRPIANMITREMRSGTLRRADGWEAAMHLKSLIEGHVLMLLDLRAIDQPSSRFLRDAADSATDVFLRAYAGGSAAPRVRKRLTMQRG